MSSTDASTFGLLLRRYRLAAGLTQEELAERAGLSAHGISNLERGVRRAPQRYTRTQLAEALGLSAEDRAHLEAAARTFGGSAHPSATGGTSPPPLIGREHERELIDRHLTGNGPPMLLLAGEPGIGKSRLLVEAARRAQGAGLSVLQGGCQRRSGQEPYAPIPQALARHLEGRPAVYVREALHSSAAWLVRLLPELLELVPAPRLAGALPAEQERRLVFAAVSAFLTNVAGPGGTLLVLDDLQWAGSDALDLLEAIAREAPGTGVRIVGAYRSTETGADSPLAVALADLSHAGLVQHAAVQPLTANDASALLEDLLQDVDPGNSPEARAQLLRNLVQRAGGVPFFLVSYAQSVRSGALRTSTPDALPWDLAQGIRQRVASLPSSARDTLRASAVIGRDVSSRLLLRVTDLPEEELLAALDAACTARLLETTEAGYRFAHDVIREVIDGDLGPAHRVAAHRRIAQALEEQAGEPPVELLAYHYARGGDDQKAVLFLEQAGDAARARYAHAAAAEHYDELVTRLESLGRSADLARAAEKLGSAERAAAQFDTALASLERAAELYRVAGDLEGETRVIALLGRVLFERGRAHDGIDRLRRHLETLRQAREDELAPGPLAALWRSLSALYWGVQRHEDALEAAERASLLGRAADDPHGLAESEMERGIALSRLGRSTDALPILEEAARVADAIGDLRTVDTALFFAAQAQLRQGNISQAADAAERGLQAAEQLGDNGMAALLLNTLGVSAFYRGDWTHAECRMEHAVRIAESVGPSPFSAFPFAALAALRLAQGDLEATSRHLEAATGMAHRVQWPGVLSLLAVKWAELDLTQGNPDAAITRLEPQRASAELDASPAPRLSPPAVLALAYLQKQELIRAEEMADRAVEAARTTENRVEETDALRIRGMVLAARGNVSGAACVFEESLALSGVIRYSYAEAQTLREWGRLSLQQGATEPAQERLGAAAAIFQSLGARRDLDGTRALLYELSHAKGRLE
jgi:tetratricopeptide (TPR) repeat protein/transcriptional regulator with XRE-family HTH domain